MEWNILKYDPYLKPYEGDLDLRMNLYRAKLEELTGGSGDLSAFACGYDYYGFHRDAEGWVYREWAPAAEAMFLTGDFNGWDTGSCPMEGLENGVFEVRLPADALAVGQKVQAIIWHNGQMLRRIPSYATRVVQDTGNNSWCAELDDTLFDDFAWTDEGFAIDGAPFIYECHVGMAQEDYRVGTYTEFADNILPRVRDLGYNAIQIMAIMEHPYYGSFGYQVSNLSDVYKRQGQSRELKALIDRAHGMGIAVFLDVVHSHAVKNTNEGLGAFDGTEYQYFHRGSRGNHSAWDTKLFNYGKNQVLHFLLSNLKYWMQIFHFDGFRFDGVTSMLYQDHGLGSAFTDYSMYFSMNTDTEAVTYLQLANNLIHQLNPRAVTIAEDMSGMPGMCLAIGDGGIGFDYRLSMGVPDLWIKTIKECRDEDWDMFRLWYELTGRRPMEKNVGYCESHDQALVGDKTIMFRLCDAEMYTAMRKDSGSMIIDRGVALHKMIRLLTATLAGEGYLNFMGNEFGHPEWIDFPREGNGWSYHYCRRQWSLVEDQSLRYCQLNDFDRDMVHLLRQGHILEERSVSRWIQKETEVILYTKGDYVFAFNFHPTRSFDGYFIPVENKGHYRLALSSDDPQYGGFGRTDSQYVYEAAEQQDRRVGFLCYLPARTGMVFKKID